MTIKQLIEQLHCFPDDAKVFIEQPAYDYWHSILAVNINSVDELPVAYSDYHESLKIYDNEDDDYNEFEVIIRSSF